MANPFKNLADLIEQILEGQLKPANGDVLKELKAIRERLDRIESEQAGIYVVLPNLAGLVASTKSELDEIKLFLGVQPVLVVTEQEISDLREKIKAIRQSIGVFNP